MRFTLTANGEAVARFALISAATIAADALTDCYRTDIHVSDKYGTVYTATYTAPAAPPTIVIRQRGALRTL